MGEGEGSLAYQPQPRMRPNAHPEQGSPPEGMVFGYADPPYLGCGVKHYGALHDDAADFDTIEAHQGLIERLVREYPDGWAMSLHTPSLRALLPLCPPDVRVAAWVKPFCAFKANVNPAYAWEPVIWRGGRKRIRRPNRASSRPPSRSTSIRATASSAEPKRRATPDDLRILSAL